MNSEVTAAGGQISFKYFRSPQTVAGRFIARRTVRGAAFWAVVFGGIIASKASGYATAYATPADRAQVALSFGNNIGLNALVGTPHHIDTVAGFTEWNLGSIVLIGCIWALLLATKTLRGEEDAGRWELLLGGQVTRRKAAQNALAGLGSSLAVMYVLVAAVFVAAGRLHSVGYSTSAGLFFALAAVSGPAMFLAIGAVASQLMPTRAKAAGLAAVIFGVSFLLRAVADTTSAHWLLNITPLGWIEKLQPLFDSKPLWLLPIGLLIAALAGLTLVLAGRDLGDSVFADRILSRPHTGLLGTPLGLAIRLTRLHSLSWLAAIAFMAALFGMLAKSAGQLFANSSKGAERIFSHLSHLSETNAVTLATKAFLSITFFLVMLLIMMYVASALGRLREDEAEGYLDNFLVRSVGRLQWLFGRLGLILAGIALAGLAASVAVWAGEASQGAGISYATLLPAGINAVAPAVLSLGCGVFAFGFVPRLTTLLAYSVVAWSFLINIISSGVKLNHWILDTSIFTHMALAPASNPRWGSFTAVVSIGMGLLLAGAWQFSRRDLQSE